MVNIGLLIRISFVFFVSFVARSCVRSREIDYQLLDDFDVFLDGVNSVKFEVRACNDVHLLLMQNSAYIDVQSYEIIIGGWNNTKSAICKKRTGKCVVSTAHQILDCNNLRAFWIHWDKSAIRVGRGSALASGQFMVFNDSVIFELKHIAVSSGYWIFDNHTCECCSRKPRYCQELQQSGITESGIYTVTGILSDGVFEVYCDMETDNGGWVVFQRRQDGSENFTRGWEDYENGFGNLKGEFWLGNRHLSMVMSKGCFELRIDLEDWRGNKRYAKYHTFILGTSLDNYKLTVADYSGDAGDALIESHSGCQFTTIDHDNDQHGKNCAQSCKGGWWYSSCHSANLNGLYYSGGKHESYADGVNWDPWLGFRYSLKTTKMMLREK